MCISVLPTYMYVPRIHTMCSQMSGEGIRLPGTKVIVMSQNVSAECWALNPGQASAWAASIAKHRNISPAPENVAFYILLHTKTKETNRDSCFNQTRKT